MRSTAAVLNGADCARSRRAKGVGIRSGGAALFSAAAAFAVPAAFGVAQPLPTVPADATQPGLGHSGLLVGEPFRLGQGHPEGPAAGEHPAAATRLPRP